LAITQHEQRRIELKKRIYLQVIICTAVLALVASAFGNDVIPEKKRTTLGLYVNSKDAYAMWISNPEKIAIIDCRTPEEYIYVGHAPMAYNIPLEFVTYDFDTKKKTFKMKENAEFLNMVKKLFNKDQTLLIMCRSGNRSAESINLLAKSGYKNVYNIYDGFEGDKVKDEASYFKDMRMVNGWKNSGNPWTCECDPSLVINSKK
jgi:rhodanese-related sulfurtransferase